MFAGQYFDMGELSDGTAQQKGWGGIVSVTAPVAGGTVYGSVGYKDAEDTVADNKDYKLWNIGLGYAYSFSKRTTVYAAAGYTEDKTDNAGSVTKTKTTEVAVGLVHKF